ncbi:hypothetical protein FVE85_2732 [Porphyridium purpureum]|uniref:C2 domain-containing protein n=1 Tax=Porphyridium purpureum TaxID=35688 RepID=A0A5J4YSL8_PORPP|nr:hypothetical protein FVE85_2732 [Porphyridium purpureum]|eukprot:POR7227..scf227_4
MKAVAVRICGLVQQLSPFVAGLLTPWILSRVLRVLSGRQLVPPVSDDAVPPPVRRQLPLYEQMESAAWLNRILAQLWLRQAPFFAAILLETLRAKISENPPPFVPDLFVQNLCLGNRAPQLDHLKTFRTSQEDKRLVLDADVDWLTSKFEFRLATKWMTANIPLISVEKLNVRCKLRLVLELDDYTGEFHALKVAFVERPRVEMSVEPLSLSFDICSLPALSNWVFNFISVTMSEALLWPRFAKVDLRNDDSDSGHGPIGDNAISETHDQIKRRVRKLQTAAAGEGVNLFEEFLKKWLFKVEGSVLAPSAWVRTNVLRAVPGLHARMPHDTKGVLHVRVIEASRLRFDEESAASLHGGKSKPSLLHLGPSEEKSLNSSVTITLGERSLSTKIEALSSSPYFTDDQLFELYVKDPRREVLLIQALSYQHHKLDRLFVEPTLIGSAWLGVQEAESKQGQWIDLWLGITKMSQATPLNEPLGYVRIQLLYESVLDLKEKRISGKRPAASKSQSNQAKGQTPAAVPLPVTAHEDQQKTPEGPLGVWQLHLLDGGLWKRQDDAPVMEARCNLYCGKSHMKSRIVTSSSQNFNFTQYFEFPVYDEVTDVLHIVGVDHSPFAASSYVGDSLLALEGLGDVQPTELWVRLKRRTKAGSKLTVTCGWIHMWVSFKAYAQRYGDNTGDFVRSKCTILINPPMIVMRERDASIKREGKEQQQQHVRNLRGGRAEAGGGPLEDWAAMDGRDPEQPGSLLWMVARRLPHSIFGVGALGARLAFSEVLGGGNGGHASEDQGQASDSENAEENDDGVEAVYAYEVSESSVKVEMHSYVLEISTGRDNHAAADGDIYVALLPHEHDPTNTNLHSIRLPRERHGFQRGGVDFFLVSAPLSLDQIGTLQVSHTGNSWLLNRMCVRQATGMGTASFNVSASTGTPVQALSAPDPNEQAVVFDVGSWIGSRTPICLGTEILVTSANS